MKKLFISQPMRDKTNEQIKQEREKAVKIAQELVVFENAPHDAKPLWFIGKSLELLSTADVAFFVKGWEEYRGCRIEQLAASQYGIPVLQEGV